MADINKRMELLVNHLKEYGFVFQGSQIYGGLSNSWDYGPLGAQLKNRLQHLWWERFVTKHPLNVGLDSAIVMNSSVWKASGHLDNFYDLFVDCKSCIKRFRVDHLLSNVTVDFQKLRADELQTLLKEHQVVCPNCKNNNFTSVRSFDLMFKTQQGVLANDQGVVYLRPETAQGIFVNFKNIQRSLRKKLPFGVGQIGKAFRNEITPGHFIFRTREFEQMELEFFFNPNDQTEWFDYWLSYCQQFLLDVGIKHGNFSLNEHEDSVLAHYAKRTVDIEYNFPFGKQELWGISNRSSFDLKTHSEHSGEDLSYLDSELNAKIFANVIEPSVGVGRLMLAILNDAYDVEILPDNSKRTILRLNHNLAPYYIAILPLSKQLNEEAYKLYEELANDFLATYDETQNIGKRYRRQDAIGTPYCITVDFKSLRRWRRSVTVRFRDTMVQKRVKVRKLRKYLKHLQEQN